MLPPSSDTVVQKEEGNVNTENPRKSVWSLRSFEGSAYPEESIIRVPLSDEEKNVLVQRDAKNKYLLECHIPPIVWTRAQFGVRIQDMTERHYHDVSNIIEKFIPFDPLLKNVCSENEVLDSYLCTLMGWYPKTQSLVAIKEGTREIIGVLLGRLVVEPQWFDLLSQIEFFPKKDKYAYLKRRPEEYKSKSAKDKTGKRMSMRRGSKRRSTSGRKSMKRNSRKSMGARKSKTGGSRKSMGPRSSKAGGSRKSMGPRSSKAGGSRKSMGPRSSKAGGSRKSMGPRSSKAGGSRKSMGPRSSKAGRKSMSPRKSKAGRKSMGGRKSLGGKKSKGGPHRPIQRQKGDWKVERPVDIIPEEEIPVTQAVIFDDNDAEYACKSLQSIHNFKKKMSDRFKIWKLLKRKMYYRVYLVAVSPAYQSFDVEKTLFLSLHSMCNAFNIDAIAGILSTYSSQNAFYSIGGLIVYEVGFS